MRIDAGLIIGVALEFIIMLYFANSTLQPKKNYYISSAMCFVGYLIVFAFSLFNQLFVNVGVFIVINLLIFNLGYRINFKTSIFQTIMFREQFLASERQCIFPLLFAPALLLLLCFSYIWWILRLDVRLYWKYFLWRPMLLPSCRIL